MDLYGEQLSRSLMSAAAVLWGAEFADTPYATPRSTVASVISSFGI